MLKPKLLAVFAVLLLCGCPSQETMGLDTIAFLGPGVINDPANKSLRFDLLKFGLEQFCTEMRRRGAPLKLRDNEPVIGRFFADSCDSQIIDRPPSQSFIVRYSGRGYAWTNVSQRLGFRSSGMIEFAPDFQLHDGAMYVYFKPRNINASTFETTLVESRILQTGLTIAQVNPNEVGSNVVLSQLQRGFTVIRYSERGEMDYTLGLVGSGYRPIRPFKVVKSEKRTLDDDETEVHSGQQDFVGGFHVEDSDQALYLTMTLDGAPAIDVFVIPAPVGNQMLAGFTTQAGPARLMFAPIFDEVLQAGNVLHRSVKLPPGDYYLMLDNSAQVGRAAPPQIALDDRAAKVDYLVQLGDAP